MPELDPALGQEVKITPAMLSGFTILSEIGRGGMGSVWLARDERLDRRVAIKTLHPDLVQDDVVRTRFMQEARALARVNHPNIVRIYNLGPQDEQPHFVMEYVEGAPLMEAAKRLTVTQKVELARKIALAVDFLHQHGIVHRDLKPGNILVGSDLEPRLLDFGLARLLGDDRGLSQSGYGIGTPDYFSPEQTISGARVDERSDIFALGVILYEMLTGALPFRGETLADYARELCTSDPMLPRRVNHEIPGDLQSVCLKALEKRPEDRYQTARDLADDLARVQAGDPVLAQPTAFSRIMSGRVEQHLRELRAWRNDEIINEFEYDKLRKAYDHLNEKEDAWIMEFRRLTLPQVGLYMGAWIMVIASALILLFYYRWLPPWPSFIVVGCTSAVMAHIGIRLTKQGKKRASIAYLLAFCFLLPITFLLGMQALHLLTWFTKGKDSLELLAQFDSLKTITNAQLWWAIVLALPAYTWIRRFTDASVFTLMTAFMTSVLGYVTLFRLGFAEWETGQMYSRQIPIAIVLFTIAVGLEKTGKVFDSQHFYPFAVLFSFIALSGVAGYYTQLLDFMKKVAPFTRGEPEYLFIANAGVYYVLQRLFDELDMTQSRNVAKVFRFVIPGHIMTSTLILGLHATQKWEGALGNRALHIEARTFEVILPLAACFFVFACIPKQMKNYLASGLVFLAIGLVRLQQNMLKDRALWPVALLIIGFCITAVAVKVRTIRATLTRQA